MSIASNINGLASATPVGVSLGGTGAATLTTNGILYGNGTSAISATAAGTTGQVLTGVTSGAPVFSAPAYVPMPFTQVTNNTPVNMVVNHGYMPNFNGTAALVLPTTSAVGDVIWIVADGSVATTAWQVTYTTNQYITKMNTSASPAKSTTTTGNAASAAGDPGVCCMLVCTTANLIWQVANTGGSQAQIILT